MIILLTHYPDSQGGGGFRSERESAHLNPMGLRKCHPITVKSLIVKVSQKHSSTLTNFLPEEHSIHTREISQEIGNCHMTNTNNLFGESERKKYGIDSFDNHDQSVIPKGWSSMTLLT